MLSFWVALRTTYYTICQRTLATTIESNPQPQWLKITCKNLTLARKVYFAEEEYFEFSLKMAKMFEHFWKIWQFFSWKIKILKQKKHSAKNVINFGDIQTLCSANNRNRTTYSTHANFITLLSINICLLLAIYDIHSPEGIGKRVLGLFLQGGSSSGYGKR